MTDKDTGELVSRIQNWLCVPQSHLNEVSRKKILEAIVQEFVEKKKQAERNKARAKDFLLYASVIGVLLSALPHVLKFLGLEIQ